MSLDRIIEMTEVDQISGNDYIHLQSPTLGDRKFLASRLGNAPSEGPDFYFQNEKIVASTDTSSFRIISFNDGKTLQDGDSVVIIVRDSVFNPTVLNVWGGIMRSSNIIIFEGNLSSGYAFRCVLNNTSLQVTALGDYRRDIYCNLVKLPASYYDGLLS